MNTKATAQHTPTPWIAMGEFIGSDEPDYQTIAYASDHRNRRTRPIAQREADAAFIVRACNAHDGLVAALRKTDSFWNMRIAQLGELSDEAAAVHAIVRAALAKAE